MPGWTARPWYFVLALLLVCLMLTCYIFNYNSRHLPSANMAASYSYHKSDPNRTNSYRKIRNKSSSSRQHTALWITWGSFLSLKSHALHDMYISISAKKEGRNLTHYTGFYYPQRCSNLSIINEEEAWQKNMTSNGQSNHFLITRFCKFRVYFHYPCWNKFNRSNVDMNTQQWWSNQSLFSKSWISCLKSNLGEKKSAFLSLFQDVSWK